MLRTTLLIGLLFASTLHAYPESYLYTNGGNACSFGAGALVGVTIVFGNVPCAALTALSSAGLTAGACGMYSKAAETGTFDEKPSLWLLSSSVVSALTGTLAVFFGVWLLGLHKK
jgi:hypothetical protein